MLILFHILFASGDKPRFFLFIDKMKQKAYRGFECRLDPHTAGVIPWNEDEEPLDEMVDVRDLLQHVEETAEGELPPFDTATQWDNVELRPPSPKKDMNFARSYKQSERDRLKSGTYEKIKNRITEWCEADLSCETADDCFKVTDFVHQVAPYQFVLKAPFDGIEHATTQSFKKQFRVLFPESDYPYCRCFYNICLLFTLF